MVTKRWSLSIITKCGLNWAILGLSPQFVTIGKDRRFITLCFFCYTGKQSATTHLCFMANTGRIFVFDVNV